MFFDIHLLFRTRRKHCKWKITPKSMEGAVKKLADILALFSKAFGHFEHIAAL